jgi:hypothetical protein
LIFLPPTLQVPSSSSSASGTFNPKTAAVETSASDPSHVPPFVPTPTPAKGTLKRKRSESMQEDQPMSEAGETPEMAITSEDSKNISNSKWAEEFRRILE